MSEIHGDFSKFLSELEKAVVRCEKDQIVTDRAIECIENGLRNFEKSLAEQKSGIESLSATQKEYAISLSNLKDTGAILSGKFAQSVHEMGQRFSEIERATENRYNEYDEKLYSIEVALEKGEQVTRDFNLTINAEIKLASNDHEKKHDAVQSELNSLRNENTTLLKSLLMAKGISITSFAISLVLFILFLTGVLR